MLRQLESASAESLFLTIDMPNSSKVPLVALKIILQEPETSQGELEG